MFWITVLWLSLMGALAAADHLGRRLPALKTFGRAMRPYEGWVGVVGVLWGVWSALNLLIHISVFGAAPVFWIFSALVAALVIMLGFVLGLPAVAELLGGELRAKLEAQHARVAPRRASLGTSGLITAGLSIVMYLLRF